MDTTPDFVSRKTWNKVLNYIASSDEVPPYLLVDREVVREKVSIIGKNIDAIIVDSTDIVGFAKSLFAVEFFKSVKDSRTDEGMFVTLAESFHFHKEMVIEVQEALHLSFPVVDLYTALLVTYAGNWRTFSGGSKKHDLRKMKRPFSIEARYYSDEVHHQAFLPPKMYERLMRRKLQW